MDMVELYRDVTTYNSEFNHDASDKMQFMGQGEIPPPASCFICGTGNCEAGYLSTGIWAEFIGNLLICMTCLVMGAEKAGCLAPSVKALFEKNIGQLQEHAQALESDLRDANIELTAYRTLMPMPALNGNGRDLDSSSVSASEGRERQGDVVEPVVIEPVTGEKPKRVEDITGSDVGEESGVSKSDSTIL